MHKLLTLLSIVISGVVFGQENVELQVKLVKDQGKHLYMVDQDSVYKIAKKELTKEGIKQIKEHEDQELTIFIPPQAIVNKTKRKKKAQKKGAE